MMHTTSLMEPARKTRVAGEFDLCVIGGSCTGVFAAVRAARLGLRVALVEQNIVLGGMAAAAQVNEWHTLEDALGGRQIIGGLTVEVLDRLRARNVVRELEREHRGRYYLFNSAELSLELEALIASHDIRLFLKSSCVTAIREGNKIIAAILEDKSGRRAVKARVFIDASGDGDLLRRAGFAASKSDTLQPVSCQMLAAGLKRIAEKTGSVVWHQVKHRAEEFGYAELDVHPWVNAYPAPADITNLYSPRLNGVDASDADQLTTAVLEGRRRLRVFLDMVRAEFGPDVSAISHAHSLGIRETWRAHCLHRLLGKELLSGKPFPDAIGAGTYPVDIHSAQGTVLRYLNGREEVLGRNGEVAWGRWRDESGSCPPYYDIPYRCLVPLEAENLLVAGRLLDADREAFGGVRVMVNMNQTGEATGTAAWLAIRDNVPVAGVDVQVLRETLQAGGSLLPGM